jgi:alpha-beta hydrolase superfamily lysophospholipase
VRLLAGILRWLLTLIVGIVVLVFLASVVFNSVTSDANEPVQELWHGKLVRTHGFLTAYRSWGTHGTLVVLVGGFLEPSFVWERVGPLLAQKHRVYAFDLDGFGYTERHGPWRSTAGSTSSPRSSTRSTCSARWSSVTRSARRSPSRRRNAASPRVRCCSTATR